MIRNVERSSKDNRIKLGGHIRVYHANDPSKVIYDEKNVIVQAVKSLFARLMANSQEPLWGVWGLALGLGDPNWAAETQPDGTATQYYLFSELLRKKLSTVNFVDNNLNPVSKFTNKVDFQTIVNATTDNIQNAGIREMGLIGGGSAAVPTNMLTAAYWNPAAATPSADTVTLINYKTLPPLILPPGVDLIFSWVLSF